MKPCHENTNTIRNPLSVLLFAVFAFFLQILPFTFASVVIALDIFSAYIKSLDFVAFI